MHIKPIVSYPASMRTFALLLPFLALLFCCASPRPVVRSAEAGGGGVIRVEEKKNGVLIIIPAGERLGNIRCWQEAGGIFSVTLYPASSVPSLAPDAMNSGTIEAFTPIPLPESVQLSFKIKYAVTSHNVQQDESTNAVYLSLFLDRETIVE